MVECVCISKEDFSVQTPMRMAGIEAEQVAQKPKQTIPCSTHLWTDDSDFSPRLGSGDTENMDDERLGALL